MNLHLMRKMFRVLAVAVSLAGATGCSEDVVSTEQPKENRIPGSEVGVRELKLSVPRMSRFDKVIDRFSCRIHLRGRKDRVNYPVNIFLSADTDSLYIEGDDPILSELPHQMYHLNAITFAGKNMSVRGDDEAKEDTVYVGARLNIEDPNNIHFGSSFNVGANSIGSGTEDDPWIIASGDDFMTKISDPMTRGETHDGKYFEITRNLNLNTMSVANGKGWEPAGHNNINGGSTDFNGVINGCDNYIENLYCYTDAGYGGLFYSLGERAYIHNLEMRRVMLIGNSNIGAFACTSKEGCRLDSIEVNGTIEGKSSVGGLIGAGDAKVRVCISSVNISIPEQSSYIGGMIGRTAKSEFVDCIRTGRIDAPTSDYVGGFLGYGDDGYGTARFIRCYTSGSVAGYRYVGGFAGGADADFTDCHAGATLPQDSYAYTTQWDVFNLNNRMNPFPLTVEASGEQAGGFIGSAGLSFLSGENSFAYSSPAKPNIIADSYAGAFAGRGNMSVEPGVKFTSYAYVEAKGGNAGGVIGYGKVSGSGAELINYGNVTGGMNTGGVIGYITDHGLKSLTFVNSGNVKGDGFVGGTIGACEGFIDDSVLKNDGNVEGTGDCVGGLIGQCSGFDLAEGSHVSSDNGSLKISGKSKVGGVCGSLYYISSNSSEIDYCPVYANIISSGGMAGGLVGYAHVTAAYYDANLFREHHPVRVSITTNGGDNTGGVLGYLANASIKGIDISGFGENLQASITTNGNIAGGIIGRVVNRQNSSATRIRDCHSFATISSTASSEVSGFGGIVGWYECEVQVVELSVGKCSFQGSLAGPNMTAAAGIVGFCKAVNVSSSYNAGRVDAVMSVGGIVGRLDRFGHISDCFNMGEVPSASGREWLAGIIGQKEDNNSDKVNITNCYNVGQTGWGIIGGEKNSKYSISHCYYLNSASNGDMKNSGSQSKNADELRRKSTFSGWSESVWEFHEGSAAPTLKGVPMFNNKLPLQK